MHASSLINIVLAENNTLIKVAIYDIKGKLVFQGNEKKMNISNLNKGIYFVRVFTNNGLSNQRIVKL